MEFGLIELKNGRTNALKIRAIISNHIYAMHPNMGF